MGTLHSVTNGCFREFEFHRLLSGDESKERTVASVPKAEMDRPGKRTLRNDKTPRASKLAKGEKYTDQGQNTTRSIIANGLLHHLA